MRITTNIKGGGITANRSETFAQPRSLKIRTGVKGGGITANRTETFAG